MRSGYKGKYLRSDRAVVVITFGTMSALEGWYEELPQEWQEVAQALRTMILNASPAVREEWKYRTPFFAHHRWMSYLSLQKQGLVLGFVDGKHMLDADGLFASTDHKMIRHFIPAQDPHQLPVEALRRLLQEAIAVNEEVHAQQRAKRTLRRL